MDHGGQDRIGLDHVALLRGINVGTAKRVPMVELRAAAEELGHQRPATLLNSGNLVFSADRPLGADDADALRAAVLARTGVDAELVVLAGDAFARIAAANPLRDESREAKSLSVAFAQAGRPVIEEAPPASDLAPELMVVTGEAVYQWLPDGVLASRVPAAWWRSLAVPVTARNDATVRKIEALLASRRLVASS
ncbi:DUF1697 domain-containing protein [Frigoribacterium sp. PvP032]|uniref:DUF1697 domain-containing protein n=1 Tax=Frigoribacterium sp. PvP032 TaxID=2806589 RepID=UPI001AE4EBB1|nr:DUF1697 domain-containing protein [Frigoribacterium sp. PvP032]MBP1191220.1 uncharacterized protein (DUF1697 family) [Frigoribacterium sp. PvP032]